MHRPAKGSPSSTRCYPWASALTSAVAALAWLAACGASPEATTDAGRREVARAPAPEEVSELDAMALPLERLRAREDEWAARAGPTESGIRAARTAASLARIRALRDPEGDALERARALLAEASLRRAIPGACEASVDLARLEARDAHDLVAAYLVAHRAARRWSAGASSRADDAHAACVADARRILGALEGYRPDRALLAAIDADPDADDPSVGLAGGAAAAAPGDPLEAWAAERAVAGEPAVLQSITVYGQDDPDARSVRVVLALDRVTTFERIDIPADGELPARLAIDLASTEPGPSLPASSAISAGGLARVRQARRESATRVVLDLEPGTATRVFLLPQPFRVVVDVTRGGAARGAGSPRGVDLILLDPGHGGDDFGARAFGLQEADVVLDIATRVREVLRRRLPRVRVVLTREHDVFVSLEQRAAMANAISADAFVSIHLNAADEPVDHGGVTTFVLDTTNDRQALRLAARENGTTTAEVGGLARILAGLRREEQVGASLGLAERIHRGALAGGRRVLPRLHDRGVRSAMFYVLVGATMPAVLVEASFMTREDEGRALATQAYRAALADGIAEGIARWVEGR